MNEILNFKKDIGAMYGIDSIYEIVLDVACKEIVVVPAIQHDHVARRIRVAVEDSGRPINVSDCDAFFYCRKNDGKLIYNFAEIVDVQNGIIDIILTKQALAIAGDQDGILVLKQDNKILQSYSFIVRVEPSFYNEGAILSTSEFGALEEATKRAENAVKELKKDFAERVVKFDTVEASWTKNTTEYSDFTCYELVVTHNLGSEKVVGSFYEIKEDSNEAEERIIDIKIIDDNNIKVFAYKPMLGYVIANVGYKVS